MPKIVAIAAMDESRVIGKDGGLPWNLPQDLKHFSSLTTGHTVLMGRKTYQSLPPKFRPLPKRENVVVTRSPELLRSEVPEEVQLVAEPESFLAEIQKGERSIRGEVLWLIGGEELYRLLLPQCDEIQLTQVQGRHEGDAYFPEFEQDFSLLSETKHPGFSFQRWQRR